jgi:hypothetical protein
MHLKSVLLIVATFVALNAQRALAACADTGAVCVHSDECCSGACSPVFHYCLPQSVERARRQTRSKHDY